MARTLYVASTNPGKLRDFALAGTAHGMLILPLPGLEAIEPPAEDGLTFEDNAREKAIHYSWFLPGEIVLADDSGLEVDILKGAPGIRSARYAADAGFRAVAADDVNNNLFLLQQLAGVPDDERGGRYRCVLAAAQDSTSLVTAVVSDMIRSFICLPSNAPWRRWTTKPSGRIAIADMPSAPSCSISPKDVLNRSLSG